MSAFEPVVERRSTATRVPGGIDIAMPSRRNFVLILFFTGWLCGWAFGEFHAIRELLGYATTMRHHGDGDAFIALLLCMWTLGGAIALASLAYMLAGVERARFSSSEVVLRREAFGIGRSRRYDPKRVVHLRAVETLPFNGLYGRSRLPFGSNDGTLAFDYGAKTIRFGASLDYAEARMVLDDILAAAPTFAPR
jgi:hypothetical protein